MVRESKTCCHCKKIKSVSEFWKDGSRVDGLHHNCKDCGNKMAKKSYRKSREAHGNSYVPRVNRTAEEQQEIQRNRANAYRKRKKAENPYWRTEKSHKEFARTLGISFEKLESWYKKQWMKQQAQCAMCGGVFGEEVIDHNHVTGKLRGLLCKNCNTGIGMLKDSSELCIKASKYLTDY